MRGGSLFIADCRTYESVPTNLKPAVKADMEVIVWEQTEHLWHSAFS